MSEQRNISTKPFPYKTLIWAVLIGFALWVFREPLSEPFRNMEEIVVFDQFKLKVNKGDFEALKKVEDEYEVKIASLNNDIQSQHNEMRSLNDEIVKLVKKIDGCKEAKKAAQQLEKSSQVLFNRGDIMMQKSEVLKDIKIVKSPLINTTSTPHIKSNG